MDTNTLKQINKKLHKKRKETKTRGDYFDRILIRHWNVFFNNQRNRPLYKIEQKSNTILYKTLLDELSITCGTTLNPIDAEYLDPKSSSAYILMYSSLFKYLKEVLNEQ